AAAAQADGHPPGPRGHVPVPALRRGGLDHRTDLQRRRRAGDPLVTASTIGRAGYIGLGNMGSPMAERLLDRPAGLTVFDVLPEAMTPFTDKGATAASSPAGLAAECDLVC